jgi:hypothetical protein
MKLRISRSARERGTVLVASLCLAFVLGFALAGYLTLVQYQSQSVARSQTWNGSLAVAEAGIEDGLQFINKFAGTPILPSWTNSSSVDNWTVLSPGVYTVRRDLGPTAGVYYNAYITNLSSGPSVYVVGTVPAPLSGAPLRRDIFVNTRRNALFNFALAAQGKIDLNGNNIATDSFDSSNTNSSNNGIYSASRRNGSGDVVTNGTFTNSISVGNADIMGHVNTGPNGTITLGPNGTIGSVAWVTNGNTGIENTSYVNSTMNVQFPDVASPDTIYGVSAGSWVGLPPAGQTITINSTTTTFDQSYNTPGDQYYKLTTQLGGKIYVGTNVNLVLWLTAGASFSGNDQITIASGGSLTIYTAGSFSMSGNAAVNNYMQFAERFSLLGLPACTNISLKGNAAITGTVYAPQAALSVGGGGSTTYDFVGSAMAKTVSMNGHMKFHFDEALKNSNFSRGYIASNWKEVPKSVP